MNAHLLEPVPFAQAAASLLLAILFLQSGFDKVVDFDGNLSWLREHFAKSPLRGQVKAMLLVITALEVTAGVTALAGTGQLALSGGTSIALWGAELATVNVIALFFGQRMAKDYAGAASLVPYFGVCAGTVLVLGLGS